MKVAQTMEALHQLDERAFQAIRNAEKFADERISKRFLMRAIGALMVVSSLTAWAKTVGQEPVPTEKLSTLACLNPSGCTTSLAPGEPRLPIETTTTSQQPVPETTTAKPSPTTTETAPPQPTSTTEAARLQAQNLRAAAETSRRGAVGADISYPNCDTPIRSDVTYGIVGVNGGRPFTENNCLAEEAAKFNKPGLYVNTSLDLQKAAAENDPSIVCPLEEARCAAYRWGYRAGQFAVDSANSKGIRSNEWYIDVETANRWSDDASQNQASILGTMDSIRTEGSRLNGTEPGSQYQAIYSNNRLWHNIVGDFKLPGIQSWYATGTSEDDALSFCDNSVYNFTGGGIAMVQTQNQRPDFPYELDINLRCM